MPHSLLLTLPSPSSSRVDQSTFSSAMLSSLVIARASFLLEGAGTQGHARVGAGGVSKIQAR
eukprot:CAMPEP_0174719580 /NCGR_PEP_ID=MMETSP1094-20130205/31440_1 /TAXON_ID=156173 /ORGANISM="Chrysochromulina brevifilum, Strain UTEX LB 985" /LENGTH=61 /DNA_ID=CAMNT_0015919901 /DNA_START=1 /DNA_END=186 /DNA_ORIENTATION=-